MVYVFFLHVPFAVRAYNPLLYGLNANNAVESNRL